MTKTKRALFFGLLLGFAALATWHRTKPDRPRERGESLQQTSVEPFAGSQAPPQRAPAEPATHSILVVDHERIGIPGAMCRAVALDDAEQRWLTRDKVHELGSTDANGLVRFSWTRAGDWLILGSAPGHAMATAPLIRETELTLTPAHDLLVRCVTDEGDPVADAHVALSRFTVPPVASLPPEGQPGASDRRVMMMSTDEKGAADFTGLRPGRYWYRAHHHALASTSDAATSFVEIDATREVTITMSSVWLAGMQFEGPGRVLTKFSTTVGSSGSARSTADGREVVQGVQARFPDAILASALWDVHARERTAVLVAWHTRLGWHAEELPFQRAPEFIPWIVEVGDRPEIQPATVEVVFEAPDGQPIQLAGLTLRSGTIVGLPFDPSELAGIPERLRTEANVIKRLGGEPVQVPPGRYRVVTRDGALLTSLAQGLPIVEAVAGQSQTVRVRLKRRVAHLDLTITSEGAAQWERANVQVLEEGQALSSFAMYRDHDSNVLAPPLVPLDTQVEIRVAAPGFQRHHQFALFKTDKPSARVELVPDPAVR